MADDKGIYYFVPKMIQYYLGEEPILQNAPTYLPFYEEDMKYVLEHFDSLVLKDVAEAGGYGVVFANKMTRQQKEDLRTHGYYLSRTGRPAFLAGQIYRTCIYDTAAVFAEL